VSSFACPRSPLSSSGVRCVLSSGADSNFWRPAGRLVGLVHLIAQDEFKAQLFYIYNKFGPAPPARSDIDFCLRPSHRPRRRPLGAARQHDAAQASASWRALLGVVSGVGRQRELIDGGGDPTKWQRAVDANKGKREDKFDDDKDERAGVLGGRAHKSGPHKDTAGPISASALVSLCLFCSAITISPAGPGLSARALFRLSGHCF
jgi:hypothetical protein